MKIRSLSFRLVAFGIITALVPVLAIGAYSVWKTEAALDELQKERELLAESFAVTVENSFDTELKYISQMAASPKALAAAEKVKSAGIGGATDEIAAFNQELAASVKSLGKDYELLMAIGHDGKIFADSAGGAQKGLDVSERAYFKTVKSGQVAISEAIISKASGNMVAPLVVPIRTGSGEVIGAFGIVPKIEFLINTVTRQKIGKSGYPFIVNRNGMVIGHPDKSLILKLDITKMPEMAGVASLVSAQKSGVAHYAFQGVDKVAAVTQVRNAGWALVVTQNEDEFLGIVMAIKKAVLVIGATVLVLAFGVGFFFSRRIAGSIGRAMRVIAASADEVASASEQVASSSQALATGSSEQAASVEEASSSLEEISSMTKQNAQSANLANNLVREANAVIERANSSMTQLTDAMAEISRSSEETQKIVKTIDEIAFQTNLLALNAAVEAARAGEAGAGFAVVADEVRNLAMRAADAAKNTSNLIEGSVKRIKDGTGLVTSTSKAFAEVAGSSKKIANLVGEISTASSEQTQGIEQINSAVTGMDKVVQQNAATAEESASAAEQMSAQSQTMKEAVADLTAIVDGTRTADAGKAQAGPSTPDKGRRQSPKKSGLKTNSDDHRRAAQTIPLSDDELKDF